MQEERKLYLYEKAYINVKSGKEEKYRILSKIKKEDAKEIASFKLRNS